MNKELNIELQEYINQCVCKNKGVDPSIEVVNLWIGEFMEQYNRRSLGPFEGYSSSEMFVLIHGLWSDGSAVKIRDLSDTDLESVPLFRQVKHMVNILLKDGKIKLTATKAIPPKIVKELYPLGEPEDFLERGISKLSKEIDSQSVQLAHIMIKLMKVVKEQKGVMTLTKHGEKIATNDQKLFNELLYAFTGRYNFAYFDGLGSEIIGGLGCGFSLALLSKYGDVKRSYRFYAEKYFLAFPDLLKDIVQTYSTIEEQGMRRYSLRTFERFMVHFGFIEIEHKHRENEILIKKRPLFDKVIEVSPPQSYKK